MSNPNKMIPPVTDLDNLSQLYLGKNPKIIQFLSTIQIIKIIPRFDMVFSNGDKPDDPSIRNYLYDVGEFSFTSVRCTNCGKLINDSDLIIQLILNGYKIEYILSLLGYERPCCRNTIFSSPYIHRYIDYYENIYETYLNMNQD